MHACDRRTDGQTEFSSLDSVCIPCCAVKMKERQMERRKTRGLRERKEETGREGEWKMRGNEKEMLYRPFFG